MRKYDNFLKALSNLKDIYDYSEPYSNVEISGMVALYSICFEQSWKAMKEILEINGYAESSTGSPRSILKLAYSAGIISDLEIKDYSNLLSYTTYDFNMDNDVDIKPIAKSEEHFNKWIEAYPFYSNIRNEGIILYGAA